MALNQSARVPLALILVAGCVLGASAQQPGSTGRGTSSGTKPGPVSQPAAPATLPPPAPATPREPTIMPRDTLNIVVLDQAAFTGKFLVGLDGTFDYPYVGRVKAGGMTAREVAAELKELLVPNYLVNPQIVIDLEQVANKRVTVTGEVRAPAVYPFAGEVSLLTALTMAGSITDRAADQALIFRAGTTTGIPVNLQELMSGQLANNVMLQDGDTVLVQKAEPVTVTGEVRNPGEFAVRSGMTVQQVIALAGGVTDRGKTSGIKIQRKTPTVKRPDDFRIIDVKDYKTEKVKAGDTIVVPRRIV